MSEPRNKRAIVDRAALQEGLDALAADASPDSTALRAEVLAALKAALADGREEIRGRLEAGGKGNEIVKSHCFLIDQLVRVIYDFATGYIFPATNPTAAERLGIVAVGGYGRGELAPFSDVDLLFLLPYKQTPWGEQVVEYMLYMLWDLGLKVGHATRSIDECIRLSHGDLTIRTAVLESRYVWGDQALFLELRERFEKDVVTDTGPAFVEAKLAERDQRHLRMGDSRYVLEPNIKDGKGGLRDLQTLFWVSKYLYRVDRVSDLVEKGVFTAGEYRTFAKAQSFLRTVRCHLHTLAGRAEERLTFDVQPELARALNYTDHAGASGVERFMKHYFLVAKEVGDLTRIFCAALEEQHRRRKRFSLPRLGLRRREVEGFQVDGDRISLLSPDTFKNDPVALIRLFRVAQERELDIHPHTLRQITRDLKLIDAGLRKNAEANRLFMEILASKKDPDTTLRRMNEAGVFGRFVPDFGRVVAQMQHDMYHVYTVDEHAIRAIGILAGIEDGTLAEDHPLSADIIHKVKMRRVLYLAVLLHDIAKGRGGDHSILGEQVAQKLCPRLGMEPVETEMVAWLVRWHLAMSSTAFKRDLEDPKTISDFVELVQSPERLRLLLVLTVADIRAVGPGVWNGWKGQLLRELYYRTEEHMLGGHTAEAAVSRAEGVKAEMRTRLADWPSDEIEFQLSRGATSFWVSADIDNHERWARLMRDADAQKRPITVDTQVHRFESVTELTIYAADHPGLFSRIAGAMSLSGASIVDARIFTTNDGMALDVFLIQDVEGGPYDRPDRLARLSRNIERALSGDILLRNALRERRSQLPARAIVFTVEPLVIIDNDASSTNTVIELNGRDRPGLLYDLTRAFYDLSLSINQARIATYGERVVDVFYAKDLFGLKITNDNKLKSIRERLLHVLEAASGSDTKTRGGNRGQTKADAVPSEAAE